MATLPRAVQQQVEAAEALLAANTQPETPTPAETPAADPAPQVQAPVQEAAPAVDPAPTPTPPPDDAWERRYKTLQGLFNAEVPKLQQQNKDLSAKLQEAIDRLDKQSQQPATTPEQRPAVDPKDVENFGSDLVEMVQRQTQHVLGSVAGKLDSVVSDFEKRLVQLEQALKGTTQTVAMTAEEVFFNRLATAVPDWEQINANDAFLAWLADVDPVYGQPRQAALNAAQQSLDVARVAAIFNTFKATLPKPNQAQNALAKQVSPKTAAAAQPAPAEKPVVTQAQIQAFYKELATGKYRGREAEAAQLEAVINDAIADGRVR